MSDTLSQKKPTTALEVAESKLIDIKEKVRLSLIETRDLQEQLSILNDKIIAIKKKTKAGQAGLKATQKKIKQLKADEAAGKKRKLRSASTEYMALDMLAGLATKPKKKDSFIKRMIKTMAK
tara:strand:+ start:18614 stop:18979 length:366 start_codon:yes stop_codon:yes gene_type:complete